MPLFNTVSTGSVFSANFRIFVRILLRLPMTSNSVHGFVTFFSQIFVSEATPLQIGSVSYKNHLLLQPNSGGPYSGTWRVLCVVIRFTNK